MIDMHASLQNELFEVSITQWIEYIPAEAQEHDVRLKVTPFESILSESCRASSLTCNDR